MRVRTQLVLACLALACLLCGCSARQETREFFAMDTVMQLRACGPAAKDALAQAEEELYRLEGMLSCRNEQAELARCNAGAQAISEETAALVQRALQLSVQTGGAYDPTLYPLSCAWGFSGGTYRVPSEKELDALLQLTGTDKVSVDGCRITLQSGTQLDLGGIAKGYAAGRVRALLQDAGVTSAICSLGGNVAAIGNRPDGSLWQVALQDPDNTDAYFGVLSVADTAVVTSGSYQRYFEQDGVRYHHILDPKTGAPAESGLTSVTIVCAEDTLADALSTALFVMGLADAAEYWRQSDASFEAVFRDRDGGVWITAGLSGSYQSAQPYQVLSR